MAEERHSISRRTFLGHSASAAVAVLVGACSSERDPFLRIGVCGPVAGHEDFVAAGYEFIEPSVQNLLRPGAPEDAFAAAVQQVAALAVPVPVANLFLPGSLKVVGPELDMEAVMAYAAIAFRRARRIGIGHIVFGSGGARNVPEGFPQDEAVGQFTRVLTEMAPVAQEWGITLCVEPLRRQETNFLNTVPETVAVLDRVAHPAVGLTFDIYHVMQEGRNAEDVIIGGRYIRHLHVAENTDRAAPGTHGDDFTPYFEALRSVGYSGRISVECRWRDRSAQLRGAYEALRAQIQSVAG